MHLFGKYYTLWDRYYALFDQKVYPLVFANNRWYIFQKTRNPETKEWEGGVATHIAPAAFQLNPDLDPFEGDLLWIQVIWPIEEELDLLAKQVHKAPKEEPEPEHTQLDSAQESDASIPEVPKRMSTVTITLTQSTLAMALTSHSRPPLSGTVPGPAGGGGGGGEGGGRGRGGGGGGRAAPAPQQAVVPHGNGKLEGKEPTIFSSDRARTNEFMHELKLYQFLNSNAPLMNNPYRKVAHALTFIQGAAVAEWKWSVENWVMRRPIPTPPHVDVWEEFKQDFIQDWDDMNAYYKATAKLNKLKMEGSNIDHYITKFTKLAQKAQYHEDDPAVLEKFKHEVSVRLLEATMHHNQPTNWEQWKLLTCKRQAILTSIEPHWQAFFAEKQAKKPFFLRNNWGEFNPWRGGTSNAMDTSASLSKAVTEADKEWYKREGWCFFCGAQGHVSRSCSKKTTPPQKNTLAKIAIVTEEEAPNPSTPVTFNQESVLNYLKDLRSDKYQQMAEAWGKMMNEEDFSQAWVERPLLGQYSRAMYFYWDWMLCESQFLFTQIGRASCRERVCYAV